VRRRFQQKLWKTLLKSRAAIDIPATQLFVSPLCTILGQRRPRREAAPSDNLASNIDLQRRAMRR